MGPPNMRLKQRSRHAAKVRRRVPAYASASCSAETSLPHGAMIPAVALSTSAPAAVRRREFPPTVRAKAVIESGRACALCGLSEQIVGRLEFHHINEAAHGGLGTLDNCLVLCWRDHRFFTLGILEPFVATTVKREVVCGNPSALVAPAEDEVRASLLETMGARSQDWLRPLRFVQRTIALLRHVRINPVVRARLLAECLTARAALLTTHGSEVGSPAARLAKRRVAGSSARLAASAAGIAGEPWLRISAIQLVGINATALGERPAALQAYRRFQHEVEGIVDLDTRDMNSVLRTMRDKGLLFIAGRQRERGLALVTESLNRAEENGDLHSVVDARLRSAEAWLAVADVMRAGRTLDSVTAYLSHLPAILSVIHRKLDARLAIAQGEVSRAEHLLADATDRAIAASLHHQLYQIGIVRRQLVLAHA